MAPERIRYLTGIHVNESFARFVNTITPADPDSLHGAARTTRRCPGRARNKKEKAMTVHARLQTSVRLVALLVAAAIVITAPYGIALAVRTGGCMITQKAVDRTADVWFHALRRMDA
jgi:hypothetical protein